MLLEIFINKVIKWRDKIMYRIMIVDDNEELQNEIGNLLMYL